MTTAKLTTLKSGMRLVTVDMPGINSVTVLAMVGVGGRYEDPAQSGISHFLEHLPFKGTERYKTSMDLAVAIDGVGGKHNAFTGKEYTGYWVKVGADKLNIALDVVSDLVLTAKLAPEDIEKERGVIIEEINMYEDQPQSKVGDVFEELVYQGSSLARPVIGTKETVGSLKREDFLKHWDKWYDPKHVVVGVVGRIPDGNRLKELVEDYFSKGDKRPGGGVYMDEAISQDAPRIKIEHKKTEQAHFYLGFPGIRRSDTNRYAMGILATLAGGNSSSRMFNEIREKRGLAYYAYTAADVNRDMGSFFAFEGVALNKATEAVKVTMDEFRKLAEGKIDEAEVVRAKEYVIGKLMLDTEDSSRVADLMVERVLMDDRLETVEAIVEKYKKVELDQVKQLAQKLINFDAVNLAVIGPYTHNEFDEAIG
jgi:predicted Zn-dependent peptidase